MGAGDLHPRAGDPLERERGLRPLRRPFAPAPGGGDAVRQPGRWVREPGRGISLAGQYAAVDALQTGEENLQMVARLRGLKPAAARRRTAELLARFGLEGAAGRRVATYSGGMRRRLDLAISLVTEPQVIFLDERRLVLTLADRAAFEAVSGRVDASAWRARPIATPPRSRLRCRRAAAAPRCASCSTSSIRIAPRCSTSRSAARPSTTSSWHSPATTPGLIHNDERS